MSNENFCEKHKTTLTRLTCSSCGRAICPKCLVQTPVGFKCQSCAKAKLGTLEELTAKQYFIGGLSGIIIGSGAGFIWQYLNGFGIMISILTAYAVGLCISKAISASIGNKIGLKIQLFTGIITLLSMAYNPIMIGLGLLSGAEFISTVFFLSMSLFSMQKIIAVVIAIWAAIRHFKL